MEGKSIRARLVHRRILIIGTLALFGFGCGAGGGGSRDGDGGEDGGGGGPGGGSGSSENGGDAAQLPLGAVVTEIEVATPDLDEFVLRATVPVPRGTFPRSNGMHPFRIADYDGTLVDTQVETVTRYANDNDGAEVVEVLGRVHAFPTANIGDHVRYQVIRADQAPRSGPGTLGIDDLTDGPSGVPQAVKDFLNDPTSIRISAADCFGNEYTCYPLDASGPGELKRYGYAEAEIRTYQTLMAEPVVTGSNGTLEHFLGVHSYVSTLAGENFVGLNLRFNNAHSGVDKNEVRDNPLDKVYFDRIEVTVPTGWQIIQDVQDPYFGSAYSDGQGGTVFPIVKSLGNGTYHVMRWQSQFHRRLVVVPVASGPDAYQYLTAAGQGFSRRGTDPTLGHEWYSWWNAGTARYFPQSFQLPLLNHVSNVGSQITGAFQSVFDHLRDGTDDAMYPVATPVLGWGHPYGVAYGGMTSGSEIDIVEGVDVAWAANPLGIRMYQMVHRMHSDRQPNALYDADGTPSTVEDWLVTVDGENDYVPFDHYILPYFNNGDPFGLYNADQSQINYVTGIGAQPYYEGTHFSYDPHDYQHYIRYTRSAKALVWLSNDSLAKDDLRLVGEMFRLSYHPYKNSQYGNLQGSGLRYQLEAVESAPGIGSPFGRGESWGMDCLLAAYASGDLAFRAKMRPYFDTVARFLSDSQMCSGFLQSQVSSKIINGQYRGRQEIEQAITENMLRGMMMTVYKGKDAGMEALVADVLERSLYAFVSPMAWIPGDFAPRTYTAIGPLDFSKPVYCNASQMPSDGYDAGYESYMNWSSFAYAYERTGDPYFLSKAAVMAQNSDLLYALELNQLKNIWNQSALLALAQRMNGDL